MFEYSLYWLMMIGFVTITLFSENIMYVFEIFFETFIMTSHMVNFCDCSILIQKGISSASFGYGYVHTVSCIHGVCVRVFSHVRLSATPSAVLCQAPLSWNFPGKSAGEGCHFLLQGTFPTQGYNPISRIFCIGRQILCSVPPGSPYIRSTSVLLIVLFIFICLFIFFSEHLFHTLLFAGHSSRHHK